MPDPQVDRISFDTVVVGVDGRAGGRDAITLAAALVEPGGRLVLATVVRPRTAARLGALFADADRRAAAQMLDAEREQLAVPTSTIVSVRGSIPMGLHSVVEDNDADLLVVGSTQRGLTGRLLLGDDACRTLRGAPCAVAVAPHGVISPSAWRTIAVGDDGSPASELAVAAAQRLATRRGLRIRVCSVVGPTTLSYRELARTDTSEALDRRTFEERKRLTERALGEVEVLPGVPGEALAELSGEADVIVIGSRGQGPWGRLMTGSTGEYLVRHAACPVLILPRNRVPSTTPASDGPPDVRRGVIRLPL